MTSLSPEQLYFLSKAKKGLKIKSEYQAEIEALQTRGLIGIKRTLLGRRYKLTRQGKKLLRQTRHSPNKSHRFIALGYCDHLSYANFQTLLSLGKLEQYLEGQRRIYQLVLFSRFWQR